MNPRETLQHSETLLLTLLDSIADGILVTGAEGNVILANRRFRELWRIPEDRFLTVQEEPLLAQVADQLLDPRAFLREFRRLEQSDEVQSDRLHFKDGRTYERFTRPLQQHGQRARIWSFRDVSDQQTVQDHVEKITSIGPGVLYSFRLRADGSVCFPYASLTIEGIFGVKPEDLALDAAIIWTLIHPSDLGPLRDGIAESARTLCPWRDEFRVCLPEKGELWIEGRSVPEREADGSTLWYGFLIDITERKQIDQRLAVAAIRRRLLFEQSKDGIVVLDTHGQVYELNQGFADLLGYPIEEARELHVSDWGAQWHREGLCEQREACPAITFETRLRRKNRSMCEVEVTTNLVEWQGELLRYCVYRNISPRKDAEAALRESEERFRATFNQAAVGIAMLSSEGCWLQVNQRLCDIVGYSSAELLALSPQALTHPEDRNGERERMRRLVDGDIPSFSTEKRCIRKDGTPIWSHVTASVTRSERGEPKFIVLVVEDITERKRAEIALTESRSLLQTIIDTAPVRIFWKDRELRYLGCNPAFARDAGETAPEDLIGKDDFQLGWRDQAACYRADDQAVLHSGISKLSYDEQQTAPDGRRIWLRTSKVPLYNEAHDAIGVLGIYDDITERKRSETELRIAAVTFEAQEGMVVTDAQGVMLRVNRAFTEITGYTAEEAVGQTMSLLKSGRHDAAFYAAMWESIQRDGVWQGELWNRRKNGDVYPECLTITAVRANDGAVNHYISTMSDITRRRAAEDEIKQLAFRDPLTGLPNRRLLLDRLRQALAASTRTRRYGALLYIDLDNFKTLNDTLGHHQGDRLLQQVAERLVGCVRECDTVARFGGDEFVVMLEDLSDGAEPPATQAKTVGEKILAALNQPYTLAGQAYAGTPSIGVAPFINHRDTVDELLKQADLAMYQAKAAGRNGLRLFDPGMQAAVEARTALELELRSAIRDEQFVLHYQPQVDDAGRITGVEALLRWQHPRRGLVLPATFIPLAEETGLIWSLGRWVLETACRQLVAWEKQPKTGCLTLAVNVSARQFRHPEFVDQFLTVLDHTGADPQKLVLELTESLLLDDAADAIANKMTTLKARGVGFSLDDFGTGYSSLYCLKRLPLDQLKIAQSFVRDVLTDPNDAAIACAILSLGQTLGLAVIAEGVATESQRDFLAGHGCRSFQGYLFGQPVLPDALPLTALGPA